jgi:predicted ATPase
VARRRKSQPGPYLFYLERRRDSVTSADHYPFSIPAIRSLERFEFHPKVTFLVGENGSGKSTLLEAIAIKSGLNPEGGSQNFLFSTRNSHSSLEESLVLGRALALPSLSYFVRAETFYNLATEVERLAVDHAYGGKSLHEQSHGESFFALFEHRFRDCGLYLLDEPEAALSPKRQIQFLGLLHYYVRHGCQFVIATHSPILMSYPDARIDVLSQSGIRTVAYEDTEHFLVTRGFLANPQRTLSLLMEEGDASQ